MRFPWVGLVVCLSSLLCAGPVVRAQPVNRGEVESIGFENHFRPDTWTPMVVRLNTDGLETGTYQLQVIQEDLDRDRPHYTRDITVDASQPVQRFWMYFLPKPTDGGLPDTLNDLRRTLKVQLCTAKGKPIAQLPLTSSIISVDPAGTGHRGAKFVVSVTDGTARPQWGEFDPTGRGAAIGATGVLEDVYNVSLRPIGLPENAIGYEGVDAVVWFDANADDLDAGGARRTAALEQWVRGGGKLVVCTPSEPSRIAALARLLPIHLVDPNDSSKRIEVKETDKPEPLRTIANEYQRKVGEQLRIANAPVTDPKWTGLRGPFQFARATPKDRALPDGEFPIYWDDAGKDASPFIVRWPYGLGSVTWVAANLGDPRFTTRTTGGWSGIWTRVMGWNLVPLPGTRGQPIEQAQNFPYGRGLAIDVGPSLLRPVEHEGRGAAYISLAVVFFILYWIAAGPGSYLLLANKRKQTASWPAFALAAMVATGLTVLLTRLVLQGDPVVRHWTLIQQAPGMPAVATSRVGLYIPASSYQTVELASAAPGTVNYVAPWSQNFHFVPQDAEAPPAQDYVVPVPNPTETAAAAEEVAPVDFPYRSTNKRLEAKWVGELTGPMPGQVRVGGDATIAGTLTNNSGRDLSDVYLGFRDAGGNPWLLYVPSWANGATLDVTAAFKGAKFIGAEGVRIGGTDTVRGQIGQPGPELPTWSTHWFDGVRNLTEWQFDDRAEGFRRSFPMMSFFDLLPPVQLWSGERNRIELLRRGGRQFDLSHAINAGQLVVIGRTDNTSPLPIPLTVEGGTPIGQGVTFYQWVVPLDRPKPEPTTQASVE